MAESTVFQPGAILQPRNGTKTTNVTQNERVASVVAGGALALYGVSTRTPLGLLLAAGGGYLVYRGVTGRCAVYEALGIHTDAASNKVEVEATVTINKPATELYAFWRNFENLPQIMQHLESVTTKGDTRSHWIAKAPLGTRVAWDAEITADQPNELIAWRSLEGAQITNQGQVRFTQLAHDRGTVISVVMLYEPPLGTAGALVAKLLGEEPSRQIHEDLSRFKSIVEAGEVPTTKGQSSGRIDDVENDRKELSEGSAPSTAPSKPVVQKIDPVAQASTESFPASDPPAWQGAEADGAEEPVAAAPSKPVVQKIDPVAQASTESFPASDPPAWQDDQTTNKRSGGDKGEA